MPYTITSTELEGICIWSVLENRAYTTAFSLWSFSLGLSIQALFSDFSQLPEIAKAACYLGIPFGLVLGFIVFITARFISKKSKEIRDVIEDETAHEVDT